MENPTQLYNINKSLGVTVPGSVDPETGYEYTNERKFIDLSGTENSYGTVGLNVYQIYPDQIIYPLNAFTSNATGTFQFIGASNSEEFSSTSFNIGQNYPRSFSIAISPTVPPLTTIDTLNVDYVNASGNRTVIDAIFLSDPGAVAIRNAININRLYWTTDPTVQNYQPAQNSSVSIIALDISQNLPRNTLNESNCCSAVITIPNSYIGVITDLYAYAAATDNLVMYVKDINNNIKACRRMLWCTIPSDRMKYVGAINYPLYPGDSVYFGGELSAVGNRYVKASVKLTAY